MIGSVDLQYAVIEVRRTDDLPERFVLAYCDEQSLRDLIASPNIVGCGFTTRAQAQARVEEKIGNLSRCQWQSDLCGQRKDASQPIRPARRLLRGLWLIEAGAMVRGFFRRAIAAALVAFLST